MLNVEKTIISQYANSATIVQLIQNMNEYIDPRADIDNFYSFVWDVETAQGFGLDILGRIVNVARVWQLPGAPYTLSDDDYRTLILIKALSNISKATVPAINQLLLNIFGSQGAAAPITEVDGVGIGFITSVDGVDVGEVMGTNGGGILRCYVNDLGKMQIRYTFEFLLSAYQFAIVSQSGLMLRPAGVNATMLSTVLPVFGFSESGIESAAPFGQAPFISPSSISPVV